AHVLAALRQQRLVDQVAQGGLLAVFKGGPQLVLRAAPVAILLDFVRRGSFGLFQLRAGNDLVVHAGHDLFDDAAFAARRGVLGGRSGRFCSGFRRGRQRRRLLRFGLRLGHLRSLQLRLRRRRGLCLGGLCLGGLCRRIFLRRGILRA